MIFKRKESVAERFAQLWAQTHKPRSAWFYDRVTFPLRDAPPAELEKFWASQVLDNSPDRRWLSAGPENFSGRVSSLVIDPQDPRILYAGSACGGVWRTADGGDTWNTCWPRFINQNIGALAITRQDGRTSVIAATGEARKTADSYPGSGVYMASGPWMVWTPFFGPPPGVSDQSTDDSIQTFPRRIGVVTFSPEGRIALGSVTHDESMPSGLYLDQGGEGLMPCLFWGDRSYYCHAVVFHPGDPRTIFAGLELRGGSGIWRSTDGGTKWERLSEGLPEASEFSRVSLAIAPGRPDTIYALAARPSSQVLGVFRSDDRGKSWRNIARRYASKETSMGYNNCIAVSPEDPNIVIWGGSRLHRTLDGGKHWKVITSSVAGKANTVHDDHHVVLMPSGQRVYSANDGGVAVSDDLGETWRNRSSGMISTMFYTVQVAASDSRIFGGGVQDQGTLLSGIDSGEGRWGGNFTKVLPGDGNSILIDPGNPQLVWGTANQFRIYRHHADQPWTPLERWEALPLKEVPSLEKANHFPVLALSPGESKGERFVWLGTTRLWLSRNLGRGWKPASPVFDGSNISVIAISPKDPRCMCVGTTNGYFYYSRDESSTWTTDLGSGDFPRRMVTGIAFHPNDPKTVVVTIASTGLRTISLRPGPDGSPVKLPYGHVFLTTDEGKSWSDLDGGSLPDVVINAVVYEPVEPYRIFVAGDAGVFVRQDGVWINVSGNLPNVVVSDMDYHQADRILTVATYGRGVWRLLVPGKFSTPVPQKVEFVSDLPGLLEDPQAPRPQLLGPQDGSKFEVLPRLTHLTWQAIPGALAYAIEVALDVSGAWVPTWYSSLTPEVDVPVGGRTAGRWRVFGIYEDSRRTPSSEYRGFT